MSNIRVYLSHHHSVSNTLKGQWGRPPNFLLVDFYNYGNPNPCSVFKVAADANGVEYNRQGCGPSESSAPVLRISLGVFVAALAFSLLLAL